LVVIIISHGGGNAPSLSIIGGFHDKVPGATYRRYGQFGSTKSALDLDGTGYIGETGPIGPVHFTVLHTVDRLTIEEKGRVGLIKPPGPHLGVPITTSLIGHINGGSGFGNFRKFDISDRFGLDFNR